nr:MAG TPA: hypothetical protein [Caudoviricetes sp.]
MRFSEMAHLIHLDFCVSWACDSPPSLRYDG